VPDRDIRGGFERSVPNYLGRLDVRVDRGVATYSYALPTMPSEAFLADQRIAMDGAQAYKHYRPLGPVLAIMPWNFPLWLAMRSAAPALLAGNVGLLKLARNVPQTALYMEELFLKAGFPADVFLTLPIVPGLVGASPLR